MRNLIRSVNQKFGIKAILRSLVRPEQLKVITNDIFNTRHNPGNHDQHLDGAIKWLAKSQDHSSGGGCAASYSFEIGWAGPYPETTGYIICTLLKYSAIISNVEYYNRAVQMGDWEISIQMEDGAVRGGSGINDYPIVFNTGMVILGWVDLYRNTNEKRFLDAAERAADWLCSIIGDDGRWTRHTYGNISHAYHSRVSWSLLELYQVLQKDIYMATARKNVEMILSGSNDNGWINDMHFYPGESPLTHTIAYTIRGLLECSTYLEGELKDRIQKVVLKSSDFLLEHLNSKSNIYKRLRLLPGRFKENWKVASKFSCLTGNAQISIIWLKLYQITSEEKYLQGATVLIDSLMAIQDLKNKNEGIRGAIPGSLPIWGAYMPYSYPNWATKFFADSIMLLKEVSNE